ncbi:MAG: radical SAM protein [Elusimicrobiota bacterium]
MRSKLDYTDDILILNAFLRDFRWQENLSPHEIDALWAAHLIREPAAGHIFSVYIHIPYCVKKCYFCYCAMQVTTDRSQIDRYVSEIKNEVLFYAPRFRETPVRILQVGGGTPNILSAKQLTDVLICACSNFNVEKDAMRVIEFNPSGTDPEKLAAVRAAGFNRISFGVQSLNAKALEKENREYQNYGMTRDAVLWARKAGFEIINVDLMLGLAHDTLEGFLESFEKIAELKPTTIIVPGLTLTDAYLKVMRLTRDENHRRYEALLPKALDGLRRLCNRYGYETDALIPERGIWVLCHKNAPKSALERLHHGDSFSGGPISVLGLGRYARSYLFGHAMYERYPNPFGIKKPLYRMVKMKRKEEMMRYVLYSLENYSRIIFEKFKERFGTDMRDQFSCELKVLKSLGQIVIEDGCIRFLPVRGPQRIFYGMFFLFDMLRQPPFSKGTIDKSFVRRLKNDLESVSLEAPTCRV